MGTVTVRESVKGSGVWHIFISVNGNRKSKKIGAKRLAEEVAGKVRAKLLLGELELESQKVFTLHEYSHLWLENYIKPVRRPSTIERYEGILEKYVLPELGRKPIDKINRANIKSFLLQLHQAGLSKSTIALCRDVISGVLNQAMDDELIQNNPITGVLKMLKLERDKKPPVVPMTFEEVELFLDTCKHYRPEFYPLFLTALRTGMRLGELLALEWQNIDFSGLYIRVERSWRREAVQKTKNGKSRRVDMSNQLNEELQKLYKHRQDEALHLGQNQSPNNIVFHHKDGGYFSQNTIRNIFKRLLKLAGLRDMRPHDCRHTFASLLLSNGEDVVYVKEQLGHASIQMTVDIYGHLIPGSNREAVNRLDTGVMVKQSDPKKSSDPI